MSQLQQKGLITHNVLSVYQNNQIGNSSYAKFGGWDELAIEPNSTLHMLRSISKYDFYLNVSDVIYNDQTLLHEESIPMEINPYLPYAYLTDGMY